MPNGGIRHPASDTKLVRCTSGALLDISSTIGEPSPSPTRSMPTTCGRSTCLSASPAGPRPRYGRKLRDERSYTPTTQGDLPRDDERLCLPWALRRRAQLSSPQRDRARAGAQNVSLAIATRPDYGGDCLQQDVDIEPDRPVADIVKVLGLLYLDIPVATRRHLPEASQTRRHARA